MTMVKTKFRSTLMMILCMTLIFMAVLIVRPSVTYACSCVMPEEPLKALESSTAVFVGKVVDVKEPKGLILSSADPVKVTFDVATIWKGVEGNKVTLTTALDSASCGFEFVEGESYIVYARSSDDGDGGSGKLVASLCSRTTQLASAVEDLKELGPGTAVVPSDTGGGNDSFPLVNVGISGVIIVLIVIAGAVLYRRRNGGRSK